MGDLNLTIFTVLYIVFLIIPGVVFKRFYYLGDFSKQFANGSVAEKFVTSLFLGMIVQICSFLSFSNFIGLEFENVSSFLQALHGQMMNNQFPGIDKSILGFLIVYEVWSVFLSALLGIVFHQVIRYFKLDIKYKHLRFNNRWHYYFTGEIHLPDAYKEPNVRKITVKSTSIDALVQYGEGKTKLFTGILVDHDVTPSGDLSTIYLSEVQRYKIDKDGKFELKSVPGNYFMIPYHTVLNMNVQYALDIIYKKEVPTKVRHAVAYVSLAYFLLSLILPWFFDLSFTRKLLSMFLLAFSWAFLNTLFQILMNRVSYTVQKAKVPLFLFFMLFLGLAFFALGLLKPALSLISGFIQEPF